jgi:hypothetical protein
VPDRLVRVAIGIGAVIDATVAILALFFQPLLGPLFDIPVKDPAITTIAGGEYVVVTLLYVALLRDLERFRGLLWLIALDQTFAAAIPAYTIARGQVVATWKTIGPIPVSVLLAIVYAVAAARGPDRAAIRRLTRR